jgi:DNA-damage-inducible protein D
MQPIGDEKLTVALFDQFPIRRTWHNDEWYYSLVDIVAALAATPSPSAYWSNLKRRMKAKEGFSQSFAFVVSLSLPGTDGRKQRTDCAPREGVLRIIQSIPSPNAEPFKQWLAQVGEMTLELAEEAPSERTTRAEERLKLQILDNGLHELVMFRGITTPEQHQRLTNANYAGLYNVATEEQLIQMRRLPFSSSLEEFMGVLELTANSFQRAGVASLIHQRNLQGDDVIAATAEDVGVQMRLMLEKMGLPMPEDLPRHRRLADGEWMPPEMLAARDGAVDWDQPLTEEPDRIIPVYELREGEGDDGLRLLEARHIQPPDSSGLPV